MDRNFIATASIIIRASPSNVWQALTEPALIRQYLFGTDVSTDWKVGSPITYRGVWQGKPYEDKGTLLEVEAGRLLVSTFWSALSGIPDLPENYQTVRYELAPVPGGTQLTLTQDNNKTQADADHSAANWKMVLDGLRRLLESGEAASPASSA
jgi:uncharacterized protein YndB with AHSA1/START domain